MIPAEAVEAAAKVLKYEDENPGHNYPQIASLALQSAVPRMLQAAKAEAWDEGWQKAHSCDDPAMAGIFFNPYRPTRAD